MSLIGMLSVLPISHLGQPSIQPGRRHCSDVTRNTTRESVILDAKFNTANPMMQGSASASCDKSYQGTPRGGTLEPECIRGREKVRRSKRICVQKP